MELATIVRALETLTSPLDWGSREDWLAESLRRVREARGLPSEGAAAGAVAELEALLRLPGDKPGWLAAALDGLSEPELHCGQLAAAPDAAANEVLLSVVSLRCALLAGIAMLPRPLPTTRELRATFGLRGREPQVALLAAEGLSNAAIAERLTLSSHTVRHYLERVLDRLGLHTRKGLALHLMAGGPDHPPPPQAPAGARAH